MYSRSCLDDIRWIESSLYQGPETAESVFEREESCLGPHERRRSLAGKGGCRKNQSTEKKVWYELRYDSTKKKIVRIFGDSE